MSKEKILLVDDEKNIITLLQLHLDIEGYKTIVAYNGLDALKKISEEIPDLIILDIMMPHMNGWEVYRRIKDRRELTDIPVIMLTATSGKEDIKRGLELGVVDYITKPFSAEKLVEVVKRVLKTRKTSTTTITMSDKNKLLLAVPTNIAIVGSSPSGISILQFLIGDSKFNIKAIADSDENSPGMTLARKLNIFSTTNIRELLRIEELQLIFMLSDNNELLNIIEEEKHREVEIIRGDTANFLWYLIDQSIELQEKQRSLVKDLNSRVNDLEILYEGSSRMGAAIYVNSVLNAAIDTMTKTVKADSGLVILLDEETDEWIAEVGFNFPLDILKDKEPLNFGQGMARLAIKKGQPLVIKDIAQEKHRFILSDIPNIVSTIIVPLFIKDKTFGVAYLNHSYRKEYSHEEIYLISVLASQSSISLENARLYETVKQKHQAVEQLLAKLIHSSEAVAPRSLSDVQNKIGLSINETIAELEALHDSLTDELNQVKTRIEEMKKITSTSMDKMYKISEVSIPSEAEKIELLSSLESYLQKFEVETGILTELMISGGKKKLAESIEITIFRIIQEALKNVKDHSKASNVRVRVKLLSDQFNVSIEDDGLGFDQAKILSSLNPRKQSGLNSMKEKASFLGGTFKIKSYPGRGTVILLRIPIPSQ
ncbi:MAG TPA: response regulator [Candidatus Eremiobacteraeota bacterium]|nr:MAG: Alkaline phosphatase synthesis transcriptional regulatory protein PhoP [bacterium ADurb.Bin363]HPZ08499.1 response regulator [Candidatus Eremiobacteraeota bacterium]